VEKGRQSLKREIKKGDEGASNDFMVKGKFNFLQLAPLPHQ